MLNLINTKFVPPHYKQQYRMAKMTTAYYFCNPYPWYGFNQWKTEDNGPYPQCYPIVTAIVDKSAHWLFGKPIQFTFNTNPEVMAEISNIWKYNGLDSKLETYAQRGGVCGSLFMMFQLDKEADAPVKVRIYEVPEHAILYYDPLDADKLLMVRIQFPMIDYDTGKTVWFRQEWTDELIVTYKPKEASVGTFNLALSPYDFKATPGYDTINDKEFEIEKSIPNPFGFIPGHEIKNKHGVSDFPVCDLYGLFGVIDRINLNYYLLDESNQLQKDPNYAVIDLEPVSDDDGLYPSGPGTITTLQTVQDDNGNVKQGDIKILESSGKVLPLIKEHIAELKAMIFDATGSVFLRQDSITNKGALTMSVLTQMYAPLIEATNKKRKSYGNEGIVKFINKLVFGLGKLGIEPFNSLKLESYSSKELVTNILWFEQFDISEVEKGQKSQRLMEECDGGYLEIEATVRLIAQMEELELTEDQVKELTENVRTIRKQREQQQSNNDKSDAAPRKGNKTGYSDEEKNPS